MYKGTDFPTLDSKPHLGHQLAIRLFGIIEAPPAIIEEVRVSYGQTTIGCCLRESGAKLRSSGSLNHRNSASFPLQKKRYT